MLLFQQLTFLKIVLFHFKFYLCKHCFIHYFATQIVTIVNVLHQPRWLSTRLQIARRCIINSKFLIFIQIVLAVCGNVTYDLPINSLFFPVFKNLQEWDSAWRPPWLPPSPKASKNSCTSAVGDGNSVDSVDFRRTLCRHQGRHPSGSPETPIRLSANKVPGLRAFSFLNQKSTHIRVGYVGW